jgi:hypothetical protein
MTDDERNAQAQAAYRDWLVTSEHAASRDFDKAVMTLAGGALGLSVTFVHGIVSKAAPCSLIWLALAWSFLALSLLSILVSILTSQHALRRAIQQVDDRTVHSVAKPGGWFSGITEGLNITAALTLVLGLIFLVVFALLNY